MGRQRRFETIILRPLYLLCIVLAVVFLLNAKWVWLAGCAVCLFYLGIIGSKLHPSLSPSELAKGPLTASAARLEAQQLTSQSEQTLLRHACTHVAILIGLFAAVSLWAGLGLHWYFTIPIACVAVLVTGSLLKLAFDAI